MPITSAEHAAAIRRKVGKLSAVLAGLSLLFSICGFAEKFDAKPKWLAITQAIILAAWIVFPPVWFWTEYYFVYKPHGYPHESWEDFKYGQDQAAKIWLALVTALLGLYFGKDLTK